MKIYRVVESKYWTSEGCQLAERIIEKPKPISGSYDKANTFSKEQASNSKFFFSDLVDAVKYAAYLIPDPTITMIDIPDEIITPEMLGVGYYSNFPIYSYCSIELLIPYQLLYEQLANNKESKYGHFLLKDEIELNQITDRDIIFKQIIEFLKKDRSLCTYAKELTKLLDLFNNRM